MRVEKINGEGGLLVILGAEQAYGGQLGDVVVYDGGGDGGDVVAD
jgi:hypothetical protein